MDDPSMLEETPEGDSAVPLGEPSAESPMETPRAPRRPQGRRSQADSGRGRRACCMPTVPSCCNRRPQPSCCISEHSDTAISEKPLRAGDDALNTEFIYFSAALRQAVPELEDGRKRRLTIQWLRKLFSPEYHCPSLRDKRNRFLMALAGALITGSPPTGVLARSPPLGPLPELRTPPVTIPAAWQRMDPWSATSTTPKPGQEAGGDAMPCPLHGPSGETCPAVDRRTTALLDDEFCLFSYLMRQRFRDLDSKSRAAANAWFRALVVFGPDSCPMLKGMRNDYALALLSQVHDGQLRGPLETVPSPGEPLLPLGEAARRYVAAHSDDPANIPGFCDLASPGLQQFVRAQPRLDNGAFCYVLVNP